VGWSPSTVWFGRLAREFGTLVLVHRNGRCGMMTLMPLEVCGRVGSGAAGGGSYG